MKPAQETIESKIGCVGMNKDREFELTDIVRETGYAIHQYLGPGHPEEIYENALAHRLRKAGLDVEQQLPLHIFDEDETLIGECYADLLVDDCLIVGLKVASEIADAHIAQMLGLLRASDIGHGVVVNFGASKFGIRKLAISSNS